MLVLGVIELVGYREWTEKLGSDREWIIQTTQSRLYAELQAAASSMGAYLLPLSMDVMLAVLNGLSRREIEALYELAEKLSPVPVAMEVRTVRRLDSLVPPRGPGLILRDTIPSRAPVVAVHMDLDSFTEKRRSRGVLEAYYMVVEEYVELTKTVFRGRAVVAYAGGDNIVAFTWPDELPSLIPLIEAVTSKRGYKAGIGVGLTARQALAAAAEALQQLRADRRQKLLVLDYTCSSTKAKPINPQESSNVHHGPTRP